jgi:hypothetical protein
MLEFKGEQIKKSSKGCKLKIKTPMWKSRYRMYGCKLKNQNSDVKVSLPNVWQKNDEEKKEGEIWEKGKIWVCVKWTPRFSKVH